MFVKHLQVSEQGRKRLGEQIVPILDYCLSGRFLLPLTNKNSKSFLNVISNEFLTIETEKPHLFEETGFVPWLEAAKKDITWNYYNRYEQYLMQYKNWKPTAIAKIKVSSDIILDHKYITTFNRVFYR